MNPSMTIETFRYDNRIVRAFAIATVIWGLVGFSGDCSSPASSSGRT